MCIILYVNLANVHVKYNQFNINMYIFTCLTKLRLESLSLVLAAFLRLTLFLFLPSNYRLSVTPS